MFHLSFMLCLSLPTQSPSSLLCHFYLYSIENAKWLFKFSFCCVAATRLCWWNIFSLTLWLGCFRHHRRWSRWWCHHQNSNFAELFNLSKWKWRYCVTRKAYFQTKYPIALWTCIVRLAFTSFNKWLGCRRRIRRIDSIFFSATIRTGSHGRLFI